MVERVCWVVPRDTLRRQAEEAFVDPAWRAFLGHGHAVRAADNAPDPCRGLAGYVTTYQSVAAAPELHLAAFQRHRFLLCVDELHHLPGLSELDAAADAAEDTAWSRALLPLLETARLRLLMTGTLERADRRPILWLGYRRDRLAVRLARVDPQAPGWALVGYDRRAALAERAIIPIRFGALDGEAEWRLGRERCAAPSFADASDDRLRPMLFTALRTGFAEAVLRRALADCRRHRAAATSAARLEAGQAARGLGKLLVVAPDQATARRYTALLQAVARLRARRWRWRSPTSATRSSGSPASACGPNPSVLVTVGMAYEGMDAPEISHVACLTQIRSVPWLEQMVARATRFDPQGGDYERQRAVVYHPDDPLFRRFRRAIEADQSGRARTSAASRSRRSCRWSDEADLTPGRPLLQPLRSDATELRFETVLPRRRAGPRHGAVGSGMACRRRRARRSSGCGGRSGRWWRRR